MNDTLQRPWYKKKRYLVPLGLVAFLSLGGSEPAPAVPAVQQAEFHTAAAEVAPVQPTVVPAAERAYQHETPSAYEEIELSNDNYYTNVDGERVHSPAYADSVPPGATARCGDGTYSFSQNRRGTCSRHGGVAEWL